MNENTPKTILLSPINVGVELLGSLRQQPYRGAPASFNKQMGIIIIAAICLLPVLHLWDAEIVRWTSKSQAWPMEILRSWTDAIRTLVWLGIALIVWAGTAILLKGKAADDFRSFLIHLHGWATLILLSIITGSVFVESGKLAIGRARPFLLDQVGPSHFEPFNGQYLYESFPSGHSMMAGILALSLWIYLPRLRIVTLTLCVLFAFSRLAANAHYPTDVLAGFTIGFMSALWVSRYMATRNIIFYIRAHSEIPNV